MCFLQKCVPKKYIRVKSFNIITNRNEDKAMTKHASWDCKCKFDSATWNSNQKWNNKTCEGEYKTYRECKKYYSWNSITCISDNSMYLKRITDTSVIACDEIISVMDFVSIKMTTTIVTYLSINCQTKNVRDCYIFHTVLLAIILLLTIFIICYYDANQKLLMD